MGLKYFCEYRTLNTNELWKVNIYIPDYVDEPIRLDGVAGQTCIVEWDGGDKLFEKFAIGSSASITLLFNDPAQTRELMLLGDKTAQVVVLRNGGTEVYWQGYLISDGIQHPDSGVSTPVTLQAVDMLSAASDMPFFDISCEPVTVDSLEGSANSPLNWIRKCLINPKNIDNRLNIRWSCSIKNSQYPEDDFFAGRTSFIPNYDLFASSRESTSVLWMIENIVKSVGCVFFQYGGYWYIVSLTDMALSSTLSFYEINGNDLTAKTADSIEIDLSVIIPTKLNESTYTMVQKPISIVRSKYNHSMPSNIIPNGGFDIIKDGNVLYWDSVSEFVSVSAAAPINGRKTGNSLRAKNNSLITMAVISYNVDGVTTLPFDADILFKNMEWGFTFMPVFGFALNDDGTIDWGSNPLNARVIYTTYDNEGNVFEYSLNEFGYWQSTSPEDGFRLVSLERINAIQVAATFAGNSYNGQRYTRNYNGDIDSFLFDGNRTLLQSLNFIALNDSRNPTVNGSNQLIYTGISVMYPFNIFVSNVNPFTATFIPFSVESMKLEDVATIKFQSKGNQGRVLMPYPGDLYKESRPPSAGKLRLELVLKQGMEIVFDDVYMNVSSDQEFLDLTDGGNDGKAEYELEISSSFSGFITSSYMDNFTKSDLSMIMDNGIDKGTLTEIFGKTALRFLSKPTEKIDTEIEGEIGPLKLLSYKGLNFIPLKTSVNTETNSTNSTIFELSYDGGLAITSEHRSTGDGDSSSFSTGGYGSGGSGGGTGKEFLYELGDVSLDTPINNDALIFDSSIGKWTNKNKVSFVGVNASDFLTIPTSVSADPLTNGKWQVYIDVDGTGGGGVTPPVIVNLTDLQDVLISGVTNGQALTYNSSTGKWVNTTIVTDLSNYYTKSESDARFKPIGYTPAWSEITGKPTDFVFNNGGTYGINISGNSSTVTNGVYTTGNYSNPSWITSLAWIKLTGTPTTLSGYGITDAYPLSGNPSGFLTAATAGALYEPVFSKNTAFNKNFGTSAGTVAEGNDSRINNGQTAYTWGNHASAGYALSNASNINVSAYKTALGLPTSGAYDLQWVTNNGAFTTNMISGSERLGYPTLSDAKFGGFRVTNPTASYGVILGLESNSGNGWIQAQRYDSSQAYNLILNPVGGNVGIGTTSPSYKLDVSGSIRGERIIAGYDSGVASSVNGLYGRFSTDLQSPIITATSQINIPVESSGSPTGATWKLFVEL